MTCPSHNHIILLFLDLFSHWASEREAWSDKGQLGPQAVQA